MDANMTFECPFTWDVNKYLMKKKNVHELLNVLLEDHDDQDNYFLLHVWSLVMNICGSFINQDTKAAQTFLIKLQEEMKQLNQQDLQNEYISYQVMDHVLKSTIYHSLISLNKFEEAYEVKGQIQDLILSSELDKSTLEGCKSLAWSKLYFLDTQETSELAGEYASKAIHLNPKCALWYFIKAIHLRRVRRLQGYLQPTYLEKKNFYTAYNKSQNPFFAIKLALCYKENHNGDEALKLYKDVKQSGVNNFYIYLRLALGFIYYNDLSSALECLDKAEKIMNPVSAMFLHYKGLYFMKLGMFEKASELFEEAGKSNNFRADMNLAECMFTLSKPKENIIVFLEQLLEKYSQNSYRIVIYLHLAMYYFEEFRDIPNAVKHFQKAIDIDPNSENFKSFFPFFSKSKTNIYAYLDQKFLQSVSRTELNDLDDKSLTFYKNLKDLCYKRNKKDCVKKIYSLSVRN